MDKIASRDRKAIQDAVRSLSSREERLHRQQIAYVGYAQRERETQERLKGRTIESPTNKYGRENTRKDSITLVLGPSGSGKTTFCIHEHFVSQDCRKNQHFRVYMYSHALGLHHGGDKPFNRLRDILETEIRKTLKMGRDMTLSKLDMTLYAVIDEAGGNAFFGNLNNLFALRDIVYEFATDVQLVLSGTGLDFLTTDIGSAGEGLTKIRMLPWTPKEFYKIVHGDRNLVSLVQKHRGYRMMLTNTRAATFLVKWLRRTESWGDPDDNVPHVVRGVAYDYIGGNGLKDLGEQPTGVSSLS
jgi:hypothetical protein